MEQGETIAAVSTPAGEGGIGIVRLSGEASLMTASMIFRPRGGAPLLERASHTVVYGHVADDAGAIVDEAIAVVMRAPRSYTCEDVVELQCHGGQVVIRRVLALALTHGARLAEPGEFTKRAFLNGRIDLTQAQAVMDVITAKTEASRRQAIGHLSGRFSGTIHELRRRILEIVAHMEVRIDFPEEDIDDVSLFEVRASILAIKEDAARLASSAHAGRILRDGLSVAIVGRPNVGKSSLLNFLLGEDRAIVTDIPGTTRDSIEAYANLGGVPVRLIDTAGIHASDDVVEKIGIARARAAIESADLVLFLVDGAAAWTAEDAEIFRIVRAHCKPMVLKDTDDARDAEMPAATTAASATSKDMEKRAHALILSTKADLAPMLTEETLQEICAPYRFLRVSTRDAAKGAIGAMQKAGMDALCDAIRDFTYSGSAPDAESTFVATEREAALLWQATRSLSRAAETIDEALGEDFVVIDLRDAWEALGKITGETVGEDIIDEIFSKFCLGK